MTNNQRLFDVKRYEGLGEICFVERFWAYSEADALEIASSYGYSADFAEEAEGCTVCPACGGSTAPARGVDYGRVCPDGACEANS